MMQITLESNAHPTSLTDMTCVQYKLLQDEDAHCKLPRIKGHLQVTPRFCSSVISKFSP